MDRRHWLRNVGAIPLLSLFPQSLRAESDRAAPVTLRRVRPSDPAWPSTANWRRLNDAVGGNLIAVRPLFESCPTDPQGAPCLDALANLRNPFWIGDQPAGTEVSGWLDAWTPAPSVYAVVPRKTSEVAAAVNFAREHRLRLVVKGGSHSYLGTSNAPDSLLIWTRHMNDVTLHDRFVPRGCAGTLAPVPAVTAGAGAVWMDLYNAVTTQGGRYVQGGGCTTVGVAGLVQSGGFGSFSKGFGTAAAGLLEAEIVTADGAIRTVNPCRNSDLFWAVKGGGGGTFGVVTKLTLRTHELPRFFGGAWGEVKAQSDEAFAALIARFIAFYSETLLNAHWGEQISVGPDNVLRISMVCQGLESAQAKRAWQPFFDWVRAASGQFAIAETLGAGASEARHWWTVDGNDSMVPDRREGAPPNRGWWRGDQDQVGAFIHGYDSLWLPGSLLGVDAQHRLAEALFAASRHQRIELHFNKGLAGAPPEVLGAMRDTAMNPEVTEAFALAIIAGGERPSYPGLPRPPMDMDAARKDARDIGFAAARLRRIAPRAGSYVSESNYFNSAWESAYWGEHYPRLRAIKMKYDPDGLFFVRHGVGSEQWSDDGFTRIAKR